MTWTGEQLYKKHAENERLSMRGAAYNLDWAGLLPIRQHCWQITAEECAAGAQTKLRALVDACQAALAEHLEPGGPDEKATIGRLLELLDGPQSREALEVQS